jgi:hypothetical protein
VLPKPQELCATPEDDDCDGSNMPCATEASWCQVFPPPVVESLAGIGVDGAGNVVVGLYAADLEIGGAKLYGPSVVKLSPEGQVLWAKSYHAPTMKDLAVGPDGSIAFTGTFGQWAEFGAGDLFCPGGAICPYVARLAPDGQTIFARAYHAKSGPIGGEPMAIAVDAAGEVLFAGTFSSTFDCGTGPSLSSTWDIFVAKLAPSGECLWSRRTEAMSSAWLGLAGIDLDASGHAIVAGTFKDGLSIGGMSLSAPDPSTFVARIDSGGATVFARALGGSGSIVSGGAVAADPTGAVLLGGVFGGVVDFGGGPVVSVGQNDVFLVKLDGSGNHVFSRGFDGGSSQTFVTGARADAMGAPFLAGAFADSVDLGAGALQSAGSFDVFLARFDASGASLASHRHGDPAEQRVSHLVLNAHGTPIVAGVFQGSMDMGSGVIQAQGESWYVCQVAQ